MKPASLFVALLVTFYSASSGDAVTIETVPVGNPGNMPDSTGFGSVGYRFQIGKYEVTAGQYTEFLNAVAKDDTYGLYSGAMDYDLNPSAFGSNIKRTGDPGNYAYAVAADWANRPVNWVSFWDAVRFTNWLHNGQPTGPQGLATTEDGAYELSGYNGIDGASIARKAGARFWIPSEDEWYKAAYHDQRAGVGASYFSFPTGTNSSPGRDTAEVSNPGNNANYSPPLNDFGPIGAPYYRTVVGEFELSDSPYGTYDQGGNLHEWTESLSNPSSDARRIQRGGSFNFHALLLSASGRSPTSPNQERYDWGFRVASIIVPEPGALLLVALGTVGVLLWRRAG